MIEHAIEALRAGDTDGALKALIELWRTTRSSALADAIDQLSAKVFAERGPIAGATLKARAEHWEATMQSYRSGDLEALLRGVFGRSVGDARVRLSKLASLEVDPRMATVLIDWLAHPPHGFETLNATRFWNTVVEMLLRIKDPRTARTFDAATLHWVSSDSEMRPGFGTHRRHFTTRAKTWGEQAVTLTALLPLLQSRTSVEGALAAVYLDPHNLLLRQVCADTLVEAGDARGELIALGLLGTRTRNQNARYRELQTTCREAMLGPLAPLFLRSGLRFTNGFPSAGEVKLSSAGLPSALINRPEWSTFISLEPSSRAAPQLVPPWLVPASLESTGPGRALLEAPSMRSLRRLITSDGSVLESTQQVQLETLQVKTFRDWPVVEPFLRGETMPRLRALSLNVETWHEPMIEMLEEDPPLLQRLESLEFEHNGWEPLPQWQSFLDRAPPRLKTFMLVASTGSSRHSWARDASGAWEHFPHDAAAKHFDEHHGRNGKWRDAT